MGKSYNNLSRELQEQIREDRAKGVKNPYRAKNEDALRRKMEHDRENLWRPSYVRDTEKILYLPYYNRYADKTQVFSFYHNDDITRRALHVQLVSRIARNIGAVLGLNQDLIEAISLGHDIGHTPFGHAGERFLNELLLKHTGWHFNHNIQSARVLDVIFARNISLQTLDGIICHNGEFEQQKYVPSAGKDFAQFDREISACYETQEANKQLVPGTLEGCVMRISDIIAYLGKDRQDAVTARILPADQKFSSGYLGNRNAEMVNNLIVDIIENSYGKPYIAMSETAYQELKQAKEENYRIIYQNPQVEKTYAETIQPMFAELYEKLLDDVRSGDEDTLIYRHHIALVEKYRGYYVTNGDAHFDYRAEDPNLIAADYIASMTDDYFLDLYRKLFPKSEKTIVYRSYFSE